MKNLTMKAEYVFRVVHPSHARKMRRRYQNLSLTKKLAWREEINRLRESLKKQTIYVPPMADRRHKRVAEATRGA